MKKQVLFLAAAIAGSSLPAFAKSESLVMTVPEGGATWMLC